VRNKISQYTYDRLNRQLLDLQKEMLDVTLPEIEKAREFANSEENDDMMHARRQQSQYDQRISELSRLIKDADVVREIDFTGRVDYGTDVHLENSDTGVRRWISLVGEMEGTRSGEISFKSLFGNSLIGHAAGDEVEIQTPSGEQTWQILEVKVSSVFANIQSREQA